MILSNSRAVHLETGGRLHLFMQTKACCGEAPEVALSILGHRTLLEGAHLQESQLTVSKGQGQLPERPSELCPLGTCLFGDIAFPFQTFLAYEAPSHLADTGELSPLVTPYVFIAIGSQECVSQ